MTMVLVMILITNSFLVSVNLLIAVVSSLEQKAVGEFPEAAGIITDNSYMDDIVASVSNEQEAKKKRNSVI